MKTKREEFISALKGEEHQNPIFAPDLECWFVINRAAGSLPSTLAECEQIDIARMVSSHIWHRTEPLLFFYEMPVEHHISLKADKIRHVFSTPQGELSFLTGAADQNSPTRGIIEYLIKSPADIKLAEYLANHFAFEHHPEVTLKLRQKVKEEGIIFISSICSPFVKFAAFDTGYMNALLLLNDYQRQVEALLDVYTQKFLSAIEVLCEEPLDAILIHDELDGTLVSPDLFLRYIKPFYQQVKKIAASKGKLCGASWLGKRKELLKLAVESNLDFITGIMVSPMTSFSVADVLSLFDGKITFFGGLPTVLFCKNLTSDVDFENYLNQNIMSLATKKNFIIGVSDCLPPDADFERLKKIKALVENKKLEDANG